MAWPSFRAIGLDAVIIDDEASIERASRVVAFVGPPAVKTIIDPKEALRGA